MSEQEYSTVNKGNFNWKVPYLPNGSALSGHYMQRLSLICMFAFIYSNGECNQPVTMLITDIVDKYTKSSKDCKDILNKFGVAVAPKKQKANDSSKTKEEELIPNSFAVCSYDNINKRSRFARVHSKDVKRGFDGTSLMICYPKPKLHFSSRLPWICLTNHVLLLMWMNHLCTHCLKVCCAYCILNYAIAPAMIQVNP